jgi:hypothetical protein
MARFPGFIHVHDRAALRRAFAPIQLADPARRSNWPILRADPTGRSNWPRICDCLPALLLQMEQRKSASAY